VTHENIDRQIDVYTSIHTNIHANTRTHTRSPTLTHHVVESADNMHHLTGTHLSSRFAEHILRAHPVSVAMENLKSGYV